MRAPDSAARRRDQLLVVLTLTTGALDAATFLGLGHVFSSVITGNLALLGVAAGQGDATLALSGGLALAGYAAGVLAGAILAGTPHADQPAWPAHVTRALAVELALLLAFSGEWLATSGHPSGAARIALLLLSAAAMGLQSAAVRRLGQMSTTYLTSTLIGVLTGLAKRSWPAEQRRSTAILAAFVVGAALGALIVTQSPSWLPAAVLVPFLGVLVAAAPARPTRPISGRRRSEFAHRA